MAPWPRVGSTSVLATAGLVWGDEDRDAFPDAIVRAGQNYYLYPNDFALPIRANVTGGNTTGAALVGASSPLCCSGIDWSGASPRA